MLATLLLAGVFLSGCSSDAWLAQYHMVRAENAHSKAYELRLRKVPYEERLKLYGKACREFARAYRYQPAAFTLLRIEIAIESCVRVEDRENQERFEAFAERYVQEHPTETEYGDAFPMLPME